jgi:hypothetical protein
LGEGAAIVFVGNPVLQPANTGPKRRGGHNGVALKDTERFKLAGDLTMQGHRGDDDQQRWI